MGSVLKFKDIITFENLLYAMHKSANGVRWKASVQNFELNKLMWAANLIKQLENKTYKCKPFNKFQISERGKTRIIHAPHISDRAVQKMINEFYLKPLIYPSLVYDNSASIEGKGVDFAINRIKTHLRRHYRKYGREGGILVMDYSNYFGSIKHDKLIEVLSHYVKDKDIMDLLIQVINHCDGDCGIGLGSEIFQTCAIVFPNQIDHYIKEKLHIKGFGRYMDDSYIIHHDINYLKECLSRIEELCSELGLKLNKKRTRIYKLSEHFPYLKKRFLLTETGKIIVKLDRSNVKTARRRLKKNHKLYLEGKLTKEAAYKSYQSWRSYACKYNANKVIMQMDQLYKSLFGTEETYGCRNSNQN